MRWITLAVWRLPKSIGLRYFLPLSPIKHFNWPLGSDGSAPTYSVYISPHRHQSMSVSRREMIRGPKIVSSVLCSTCRGSWRGTVSTGEARPPGWDSDSPANIYRIRVSYWSSDRREEAGEARLQLYIASSLHILFWKLIIFSLRNRRFSFKFSIKPWEAEEKSSRHRPRCPRCVCRPRTLSSAPAGPGCPTGRPRRARRSGRWHQQGGGDCPLNLRWWRWCLVNISSQYTWDNMYMFSPPHVVSQLIMW